MTTCQIAASSVTTFIVYIYRYDVFLEPLKVSKTKNKILRHQPQVALKPFTTDLTHFDCFLLGNMADAIKNFRNLT